MNIEITLLDGTVYTTNLTDYNAQTLADLINVQDKLMVAIGDIVINKHNIKSIVKDGMELA